MLTLSLARSLPPAPMCGKMQVMAYQRINLDTWPRRPHFDLFDKMAHPWLDICCSVDATSAWAICRTPNGPSFSAASLFLAIGAVNSVEQLRMRIRDNEVIVHDKVHVGSTILRDDETFGFGFITASEDFQVFAAAYAVEFDRIRIQKAELVDRDNDDVIHFSVVPWLSFTGIGHPRDRNSLYSVPKIVIGKCHLQESRWKIPVALSAHHGLVDGLHAARFFDHLQQRLDQAATLLAS
ncbi:MAG: hypothetical protein DRJ61_14935 [Acidobacteria bacterium]|nr:MAG: hypothetical protein DRJ61_14935 [Acidobacteriota bacterium]